MGSSIYDDGPGSLLWIHLAVRMGLKVLPGV
jgi:hypothetical protein